MDIQLYRRAVAEQFPQLDLSGFRLLGEGGVFWVLDRLQAGVVLSQATRFC